MTINLWIKKDFFDDVKLGIILFMKSFGFIWEDIINSGERASSIAIYPVPPDLKI